MSFNTSIDHALTRKHKAIYIEFDAKFIVEALMEDKWQHISNKAK